jgi:predicted aspartyl protease
VISNTWKLIGLFALLGTPFLPTLVHGECRRTATELPVSISGTRPFVQAKINGKDARFLIDSGAFFSMMSEAVAAEYQLKVGRPQFKFYVRGVGGDVSPGLATVKVFTLADSDIPNVNFLVGGSESGEDSVGVLGQDFLLKYDVEYDLARGMIRLYEDIGCSGRFLADWAVKEELPFTQIRIEKTTPRTPHTIANAYVNGKRVQVLFDTGASALTLYLSAASHVGIDVKSQSVAETERTSGIGKNLLKSYAAMIFSLKFESGEEIKDARVQILDIGLKNADMLIGGEFFLTHRVLIANSQDMMYFTYNGAPLFEGARVQPRSYSPPPSSQH